MLRKIPFITTLISLILFSTILKAVEQTWTDWEQVKYSPLGFEDISNLIGNGSFEYWYSEGKLDAGKKGEQYWNPFVEIGLFTEIGIEGFDYANALIESFDQELEGDLFILVDEMFLDEIDDGNISFVKI